MKQNQNDGSSSGLEENHQRGGLRIELPPFLKTQESLPQQIDPSAIYVGLPDKWVAMTNPVACADYLLNLPKDQEVLVIRSGRELLELLK